jgi:hypothetical protein
MPNTVYIEDWSNQERAPRILAVNISSNIVTPIDFPGDLAAHGDSMFQLKPAVWVCSPAEHNMHGNCFCSRGPPSSKPCDGQPTHLQRNSKFCRIVGYFSLLNCLIELSYDYDGSPVS